MSEPLYFDQEPVVGWRAWAVAETPLGPELRSVVYPHLWLPRRALKTVCEPGGCLAARWSGQPHSCGIHAFKSRADAFDFPATWESRRFERGIYPEHYLIGQVSLWGRVVEHERGYRGAIAYPYSLVLPRGHERLVVSLASRYCVDVIVD